MGKRMTDLDNYPSIDTPGPTSGGPPEPRTTPPGDTADDTGSAEPHASELDLPGPNDPVAWSYVQPGTEVVDPSGNRIGRVDEMLGTDEGIFHGIAVTPDAGGRPRMVAADRVALLTPSRVQVTLDAAGLESTEEYSAPGG
ncbi:MAG: hypothetical protein DLM71_09590 [Chloroflexi bacterium]|nr:MAG: hypothetical protein DLM71_09590 [Chloroflexota bacterium]